MNNTNAAPAPDKFYDKMKKEYPALGKIFVRAPLVLKTPAIIGSGESEKSDVDILREPVFSGPGAAKFQPLLPATSLLGVFRAYLEKALRAGPGDDEARRANFEFLFGARDPEKSPGRAKPQSALQCDDILLKAAKVVIRDGVAIDHATNTARDKQKYNYEVIEPGAPFGLNLEITLRKNFRPEIFKQLLAAIFKGIDEGHIRLGAKTNKGFGRLQVNAEAIEIAELSFSEPAHVYQWLAGKPEYGLFSKQAVATPDLSPRQFKIAAGFKIKNSLLIRSYDADPGQPDAVHFKSGGRYVMPGTSLMGAIRHRARKILQTLGVAHETLDEKMRRLFGYEGKARSGEGACKGRVRLEETAIANPLAEIQTRIKIDRFTGGTLHGALFEMMPLWKNHEASAVQIVMTLSDGPQRPPLSGGYDEHGRLEPYQDWEAALLLFILKDLWTGDLAVGGEKSVGRGVLQGLRADISWEGQKAHLQADATGKLVAAPDALEKLETLAQKLKAMPVTEMKP